MVVRRWASTLGDGTRELWQGIRSRGSERSATTGVEKSALLARLCAEKPLVSVSMVGEEARYTSSLLEVSGDGDDFWLDELSPIGQVKPSTRLRIVGQLAGCTLSFESPVHEVASREGMTCYRLKAPRSIISEQRRAHPRLAPDYKVPVFLVDTAANVVHGTLLDISLGGISVLLDSFPETHLARGDTVTSCTIRLSGTSAVQSAVEVRHVRQATDQAQPSFGGRFINLPQRHRLALESFLGELRSA